MPFMTNSVKIQNHFGCTCKRRDESENDKKQRHQFCSEHQKEEQKICDKGKQKINQMS